MPNGGLRHSEQDVAVAMMNGEEQAEYAQLFFNKLRESNLNNMLEQSSLGIGNNLLRSNIESFQYPHIQLRRDSLVTTPGFNQDLEIHETSAILNQNNSLNKESLIDEEEPNQA